MAEKQQRYSTDEIEEIVAEEAPRLHATIATAARDATNEEEFKIPVEVALRSLLVDWGLPLEVGYETFLVRGPADAVYNRFVIEYEPPGSLRDDLEHRQTAHAVQQVVDYLEGLAKKDGHPKEQLRGVALDGSYFIFVRFHRDKAAFLPDNPIACHKESTARFLQAVLALQAGKALTPANLLKDFGHETEKTKAAIRALFLASKADTVGLPAKLFEQWQIFFGEVTSYSEVVKKSGARTAMLRFAESMGLSLDDEDFPRFFFCLHTGFSFLVKMIGRLVVTPLAPKAAKPLPLDALQSLDAAGFKA